MKQDKKELYESIMASVAKEVKKALNEEWSDNLSDNPSVYAKPGKTLSYEPTKDLVNALGDMKFNTKNVTQKAILQAAEEVISALYNKLNQKK